MYTPAPFSETRPDRILGLVEAYDFATLIHAGGTDVSLTHAPVFLRDPEHAASATQVDGATLELHLARANAMCRRLEQLPKLTVAILGPSSYITPSWYETPGVVPTWNYAAVHLHCEVRPFTDPERLHALFDRTARAHEPGVGGTWNRDGDRQKMVDSLIRGVVGYQLTVTSHEAIFKMSQNKSQADRGNVIAGLSGLGRDATQDVATMMAAYSQERDSNA
ncbi:FMN-binding negative transcriptional regulator [Pseudooceanicola algae]|uniref:Protease synthase and sporulation protein PAI 2 n=1 Tax=Pseudooceanicola algae TaxID=1537215 RepID=A0A418SJ26_9RHOB|nr:FMN-binding negative transcriptional regulator [Pseudooceanicola algae]QPM91991.1 Protease synthase and sporulation protein PAI 2 [Pseudooceanicola algae]